MNKEDYFKYYIQGSDHYLIPKYEFIELFNEMSNWREETKEYKNQQKKFIEYLEYQVKLQEELNDIHLATGSEEILSKYKGIIGDDKE